MAKTKTSAEVKNRYNSKVYDRLNIMVPKGERETIKAHAVEYDKSLNSFINRAIDETMVRDRGGGIPGCSSGGGHAPDHAEQIKEVSK